MTKLCYTCKITKVEDLFYRNRSKPDGFQDSCKTCQNTYRKEYYSVNPDRKPIKKYNKAKNRKANLKKLFALIRRTPKWANLDEIESFYLNCPEGMTVDHIIPLQGKTISGLNVLENLQYLSKEDNSKKNNVFDPNLYVEQKIKENK